MIEEYLVTSYGVSMAPGILRDGYDARLALFIARTPLWADHYTAAPLDDYPDEDTEWRDLTFPELVEQRNDEVWDNILAWRDVQTGKRASGPVHWPADLPLDYYGVRLLATRSGEHGARFLERMMRTNHDQATVFAALRNYCELPDARAQAIATGIERSAVWGEDYDPWRSIAFGRLEQLDPDLSARTALSELERLTPLLATMDEVTRTDREAYESTDSIFDHALSVAYRVPVSRTVHTLRTLEAKTSGWVSEVFGYRAKESETAIADWLHGNASPRQRAALLATIEEAMHDPDVLDTGQIRWIPIEGAGADRVTGERGIHTIERYELPFGSYRDLVWELMRDHIGREKMPKEERHRSTRVEPKDLKRIMPKIWEEKRAQRDLNPRPNG